MPSEHRSSTPTWVWLVAAFLVVLMGIAVVGWVLQAIFFLGRVGIFLVLVAIAFVLLRSAFSRRD
jgi:hypothetical protein